MSAPDVSKALFSVGLIADPQHADIEDRYNFKQTTRRRYRQGLELTENAVEEWNIDKKNFPRPSLVICLGDIIDGLCRRFRQSETVWYFYSFVLIAIFPSLAISLLPPPFARAVRTSAAYFHSPTRPQHAVSFAFECWTSSKKICTGRNVNVRCSIMPSDTGKSRCCFVALLHLPHHATQKKQASHNMFSTFARFKPNTNPKYSQITPIDPSKTSNDEDIKRWVPRYPHFHNLMGNHELYNFNRKELLRFMYSPINDPTVFYYSFSPSPKFVFIMLDAFVLSIHGKNTLFNVLHCVCW